jgi:sec-independent protein translocase protein TatB
MFDIAGTELLLIVVIAVIVVGPKDLPKMMRSMGRWARKIQNASSEFRRQIDQLAREAELDDIISEANAAGRKLDPKNMIQKALDPEHELDEPVMHEPFLGDPPAEKASQEKETPPEDTGEEKKTKKSPKGDGEVGP